MLLALKESAGSRARYLLSPNWPRPRVGLRSHPHELFTMIGSFLPPKAIKPISQVRKATKPVDEDAEWLPESAPFVETPGP